MLLLLIIVKCYSFSLLIISKVQYAPLNINTGKVNVVITKVNITLFLIIDERNNPNEIAINTKINININTIKSFLNPKLKFVNLQII